ncbi:MAG: glycoside hydrolase family 97 protein [Prevotella sp.]
MKRSTIFLFLSIVGLQFTWAQKTYTLQSPDGRMSVNVSIGKTLSYSISLQGRTVLQPSDIALAMTDGTVWGQQPRLSKAVRKSVDTVVPSPFYRAGQLADAHNELTLKFKGGYDVEFRAYNDAVAYRFVNHLSKPFHVKGETVEYCFDANVSVTAPYVKAGEDGIFESQFNNSFENTYTIEPVESLNPRRLMFLPLQATVEGTTRVSITEVNIENYPGMYLVATGEPVLKGVFAPYPARMERGGFRGLELQVRAHEDYIAAISGPRTLPWRVAVVTTHDADLANCNISYLLAEPSRIADTSWIKPGKVAWDWWNDWNTTGADCITGPNTGTYKFYIDFASREGIEYVILDEGWSVSEPGDLMQVVPEIDLEEIISYGKSRNVGIILWASFYAFHRDMENVCRHYADMGVKGFKVDFLDRDDQLMTDFQYKAAELCARYHLLLDYHGSYKPAGINRTYPNVLNVEGVHGLEQMKWSPISVDQVTYDTQLPFLRQLAGPMDYTQGAMLNGTQTSYRNCYSEPMSQGTRCRQLALYMIFDSPLNMLCDAPGNYMNEPECTSFIAGVPTAWDETRVLCAEIGQYIVTARRKGNVWYIGGITNWTPRDLTIDLSALGLKAGTPMTVFRDGVNAHRNARDYRKAEVSVPENGKLDIHLAPGGGFAVQTN